MQLICPACGAAIPADEVNVKADLARCAACGELAKASELLADVDLNGKLQPPAGSRIAFSVDEAGNGVLEIPAAGRQPGDVSTIIFAVVWTFGIAAWSAVAVSLVLVNGGGLGALFPALFSIPFWVVAVFIWTGLVNAMKERQRIELGPEKLVFSRLRPIRPRQTAIDYRDIEGVEVELWRPPNRVGMIVVMMRQQARTRSAWFTGRMVPCFTHGKTKTYFAEETTDAEMRWLVRVLRASIYKLSGRRV